MTIRGGPVSHQKPSELDGYLGELLSVLWPEGRARIHTSGDGRAGAEERFLVLPTISRPKLVIPASPSSLTAGAILGYNTASTGRRRLQTRVLAALARSGALRGWPHQIRIAADCGIERHLREVLGSDAHVALYVGPPRAVQKPVLQVLDGQGVPTAFVKIGISDFTKRLLATENDAIARIRAWHLPTLEAPTALHFGAWRDHDVLVQAAVPPGRTRDGVARLLPSATLELASAGGRASVSWSTSRYRGDLLRRLDRIAEGTATASLRRVVRALDGIADLALDLGASHGDWAPWNLTAHAKIVAWDWEQFRVGVPAGHDAVHYDVQERVAGRGNAPEVAIAALLHDDDTSLTSRTIPREERALAVTLYVLELAVRYLEDGETRTGGTRLSRLDAWLEAAVQRCLEALALRDDR